MLGPSYIVFVSIVLLRSISIFRRFDTLKQFLCVLQHIRIVEFGISEIPYLTVLIGYSWAAFDLDVTRCLKSMCKGGMGEAS
jgi:hypothetical protein